MLKGLLTTGPRSTRQHGDSTETARSGCSVFPFALSFRYFFVFKFQVWTERVKVFSGETLTSAKRDGSTAQSKEHVYSIQAIGKDSLCLKSAINPIMLSSLWFVSSNLRFVSSSLRFVSSSLRFVSFNSFFISANFAALYSSFSSQQI